MTRVTIADDFRDNLIIDRYDAAFTDMRASKRKHLHSWNSEDALTWNVFRSLRQISPRDWLPRIWRAAFSQDVPQNDCSATIHLWRSVEPPAGFREGGDEGSSEIDIIIESPSWVWFIEAKFRSDISTGTTTRPGRDQIIRNIDVGSYYAGVRPFYFSLLVLSERTSRLGEAGMKRYAERTQILQALPHRSDKLLNLGAIATLRWNDLADTLNHASQLARREDERGYATRALAWLAERKVLEAPI